MGKRGQFIVVEGINGCGKTTQAKRLVDKLLRGGMKSRYAKEPTSWTPPGKFLTKIFAGLELAPDNMTMTGLFLADRMQHILDPDDGLKAALDAGITVICDRFYLSSYVYQHSKLGLDTVIAMMEPSRMMLKPDLTIFLDVPPEICYERIKNRDDGRPEIYSLQELESYRGAYLDVIEQRADIERLRVHMIKCGTMSLDDIADLIFRIVIKFLTGMKI